MATVNGISGSSFARAGCKFRYYHHSHGSVNLNGVVMFKGLKRQAEFTRCWYVLTNATNNKVCGSDDCDDRHSAYKSLTAKMRELGLDTVNVNDIKGPREER